MCYILRGAPPADPISKTAHLSGSRSAVVLAGRTSPLRPEGPAPYGACEATPWGRLRPSRVPPPPPHEVPRSGSPCPAHDPPDPKHCAWHVSRMVLRPPRTPKPASPTLTRGVRGAKRGAIEAPGPEQGGERTDHRQNLPVDGDKHGKETPIA